MTLSLAQTKREIRSCLSMVSANYVNCIAT